MIKGGIYIYPSATSYPNGKLRLLYECNPVAFLAEQAGGLGTDGHQRILDIDPSELHQRVPFFVGSKEIMPLLSILTSYLHQILQKDRLDSCHQTLAQQRFS